MIMTAQQIAERAPEGVTRVVASSQYGMGFILTYHPPYGHRLSNLILHRDDALPYEEMKDLAGEVTEILSRNRTRDGCLGR